MTWDWLQRGSNQIAAKLNERPWCDRFLRTEDLDGALGSRAPWSPEIHAEVRGRRAARYLLGGWHTHEGRALEFSPWLATLPRLGEDPDDDATLPELYATYMDAVADRLPHVDVTSPEQRDELEWAVRELGQRLQATRTSYEFPLLLWAQGSLDAISAGLVLRASAAPGPTTKLSVARQAETGPWHDALREADWTLRRFARDRIRDSLEVRVEDDGFPFPDGARREGASFGLPFLAVAYWLGRKRLALPGGIALTGALRRGRVVAVHGVVEKAKAAYEQGYRLLVVPEANREEAEKLALPGLRIEDIPESVAGVALLKRLDQIIAAHAPAHAGHLEVLQARMTRRIADLAARRRGREPELRRLVESVTQQERGFVLIEGTPGIGKSTLLASLIERLQDRDDTIVAFHMCLAAEPDTVEPRAALHSLSDQLDGIIDAAFEPPLSPGELLSQAAVVARHAKRRVVLVLDGIDEVLRVPRATGHDPHLSREMLLSLWPLRGGLEPGVHVVVAAQPGVVSARDAHVVLEGISLDHLAPDVAERLSPEQRDRVADRTGGNALYLELLLPQLRASADLDRILSELPADLEGYFATRLESLIEPIHEWPCLRTCLTFLAAAHGPISARLIEAATHEAFNYDELCRGFRRLRPLLVEPEDQKFRLCHQALRESLLRLLGDGDQSSDGRLPADRVHLEEARDQLTQYALEHWKSDQHDYALRFLASHLYERGRWAELEQLLLASPYLELKRGAQHLDPGAAAADVRLLTRVLLRGKRPVQRLVRLAQSPHGYMREGITAELCARPADEDDRITQIVRKCGRRPFWGAWTRKRKAWVLNANKVAIDVACGRGLLEPLDRLTYKAASMVAAYLPLALLRLWTDRPECAHALVDRYRQAIRGFRLWHVFRWLRTYRIRTTYYGLCLALFTRYQDEPALLAPLESRWREDLEQLSDLGRRRPWLLWWPLTLYVLCLRVLVAFLPRSEPINCGEFALSFRRPDRGRRLTVGVLKRFDEVSDAALKELARDVERAPEFDVYLMAVAERALIRKGVLDPDRVHPFLERLFHNGPVWFRQSCAYASFHILHKTTRAHDPAHFAAQRAMTGELVEKDRALVTGGKRSYELLPHLVWPDLVGERHGRGQVYLAALLEDALQASEVDPERRVVAVRVIRAACQAGVKYQRYAIALQALDPVMNTRDPVLRTALVEALANLRLFAEETVDDFLAGRRELALEVRETPPTARIDDLFALVDEFVIDSITSHPHRRAEIVAGLQRGASAKSLNDWLAHVFKRSANLLLGAERFASQASWEVSRPRRTLLECFVGWIRRHPRLTYPIHLVVHFFARCRARGLATTLAPAFPTPSEAPQRCLEIGSGTGHVAEALHRDGRQLITSDIVDLSFVKLPHVLCNAAALPYPDGAFEVVLLVTVLHHIPESLHDQVLDEAIRVLRPGGRLVILEDTYHGGCERFWTHVNDSVMNLEFFGHPHANRPLLGWRQMLSDRGLIEVESREFVARYLLLMRMRHGLLVWERPREAPATIAMSDA